MAATSIPAGTSSSLTSVACAEKWTVEKSSASFVKTDCRGDDAGGDNHKERPPTSQKHGDQNEQRAHRKEGGAQPLTHLYGFIYNAGAVAALILIFPSV